MPGVNLKHCFLDIVEDEIWAHQEAEYDFTVPFDQLNRRFIDLIKFAFSVSHEAKNDFKFPFHIFIRRFFDFDQIEIWVGQGPENVSQCLITTRKHALLNSPIRFWAGPEVDSWL